MKLFRLIALLLFLTPSALIAQRILLQPQACGPARSTEGVTLTSIEFVNTTNEPVQVFWINYDGVRQLYNTLGPGASHVQTTYVTHPWIVLGLGGSPCHGLFMPLPQPGRAVIGGCIPPPVAPQLLPPPVTNVIGDALVLINWNWPAPQNPPFFVVEFSADAAFAREVRSFRVPGEARRAVFRFPKPGTYFVRVAAANACGKKESPPITFTVTPPPPRVVLTTKPSGMLQVIGEPATDSYTLTNFGGQPTAIHLDQVGDFFTQSPINFTLSPGRSQVVTLTASARPSGNHLGLSIPRGLGVPDIMQIPVLLLATLRPVGIPDARPERSRLDIAEPEGRNPLGTIRFTNQGTGTVRGLLVSNVPWIVPVDQFASIDSGQTATLTFRIDRSQRASGRGSLIGALALVYLQGGSASKTAPASSTPPPGSKASIVTVSDTVTPTVSASSIPPLGAGEIGYFVPGVGHLQGNVGLFISDVSILNTGSGEDIDDLKVYLTSAAGSSASAQQASFSEVAANQTLNLADVSKSVFNTEGQVGSLQVRTSSLNSLGINANIFNTSNPSGTYGTSIPVFRSDRALAAQEKQYLTGLRKDSSGYTHFYVQEMAGQGAAVQLDFLNAAGSVIGSMQATVQPFGLAQILNPLPEGSVATVITNISGTGAKVLAHATPVDQLTGDTWSVTDWARQFGYTMFDEVMIPVAGKLKGANNSDFRTDVAIMNTGSSASSGTLRYYQSGQPVVERALTLAPMESRILNDVVGSLFGITTTSVGYLVFTPAGGSFAVTSRTYTLGEDQRSTFGTGVPTMSTVVTLKPGEVRKISGFEDATSSTVTAKTPGTYRTNLGLAETSGQTVTVRATMRYTAVQGAAAAVGVASTDLVLQPRQLLLEPSITSRILGEDRALFGDLRDIQVDFEIVDGTSNVVVFTTSTDNGTNDTALRVE